MGYSIRLSQNNKTKKYMFCNPQRKTIKRDTAKFSVNALVTIRRWSSLVWGSSVPFGQDLSIPLTSPVLVATYPAFSDSAGGKSCGICLFLISISAVSSGLAHVDSDARISFYLFFSVYVCIWCVFIYDVCGVEEREKENMPCVWLSEDNPRWWSLLSTLIWGSASVFLGCLLWAS